MEPDIPQDTKGGSPMTLKETITLFGYHQRSNLRARTARSYQLLLQQSNESGLRNLTFWPGSSWSHDWGLRRRFRFSGFDHNVSPADRFDLWHNPFANIFTLRFFHHFFVSGIVGGIAPFGNSGAIKNGGRRITFPLGNTGKGSLWRRIEDGEPKVMPLWLLFKRFWIIQSMFSFRKDISSGLKIAETGSSEKQIVPFLSVELKIWALEVPTKNIKITKNIMNFIMVLRIWMLQFDFPITISKIHRKSNFYDTY